MKRSRFGLGLLVVLLLLGILSTWAMGRWIEPMSQTIRQAGDAAMQEDWEGAKGIVEQVQENWERRFPLFASLSDHEPMEEINGLFAQLEVYGKSKDPQNFAAVCALLTEALEAMGEAHSLKWWNLL